MGKITLHELRQMPIEELCQRLQAEALLLEHNGQPIATVHPEAIGTTAPQSEQLRPYGLDEGLFILPDDFDDPLPEDYLRLFEGHDEVTSR